MNKSVTTLDLTLIQLDSQSDWENVSNLLKTNTTITTLIISANKIGISSLSMSYLSSSLEINNTLTTLDLSKNSITYLDPDQYANQDVVKFLCEGIKKQINH